MLSERISICIRKGPVSLLIDAAAVMDDQDFYLVAELLPAMDELATVLKLKEKAYSAHPERTNKPQGSGSHKVWRSGEDREGSSTQEA